MVGQFPVTRLIRSCVERDAVDAPYSRTNNIAYVEAFAKSSCVNLSPRYSTLYLA
jgi:hypothetical protein